MDFTNLSMRINGVEWMVIEEQGRLRAYVDGKPSKPSKELLEALDAFGAKARDLLGE